MESGVLLELSLLRHWPCEARTRARNSCEVATVTGVADGHRSGIAHASVSSSEVATAAGGRSDQKAALAKHQVLCELRAPPAPKRKDGPSNWVPVLRVPRDPTIAAREPASNGMQGHDRKLLQHRAANHAMAARRPHL